MVPLYDLDSNLTIPLLERAFIELNESSLAAQGAVGDIFTSSFLDYLDQSGLKKETKRMTSSMKKMSLSRLLIDNVDKENQPPQF